MRFCKLPGVGSMGKSMEFMGRPWFPHASHASLAFPCYAKAWKAWEAREYFSSYTSRAWISMEFMGQDLLVI